MHIKMHAALWTALSLAISAAPAWASGTLTDTHEFSGGADGEYPTGNVVVDSAGNVYGETPFKGSTDCFGRPGSGCGTVYKVDPTGALTVLVTFQGASNGAIGYGDLAVVKDTLFGEAYGSEYAADGFAGDLLFSVKTDGSGFRVLHQFNGADGANPLERPIVTPAHMMYNVTSSGGPPCAANGNYGCGVLFQLSPNGHYVILHAFTGGADGKSPGRIVTDSAGTIVGATQDGGATGEGTIYTYVPSTGVFTTVITFDATTGDEPHIGGISPDGTIYGVTKFGGPAGEGSIFKLTNTGEQYALQTLAAFDFTNGQYPVEGPLVVGNGELVGTTSGGGIHKGRSGGTIYSYKAGQLFTLYSFINDDGTPYSPQATPAMTHAGIVYGTANVGGTALSPSGSACQCGAVFGFTR